VEELLRPAVFGLYAHQGLIHLKNKLDPKAPPVTMQMKLILEFNVHYEELYRMNFYARFNKVETSDDRINVLRPKKYYQFLETLNR
jgi:hypothetical protein